MSDDFSKKLILHFFELIAKIDYLGLLCFINCIKELMLD